MSVVPGTLNIMTSFGTDDTDQPRDASGQFASTNTPGTSTEVLGAYDKLRAAQDAFDHEELDLISDHFRKTYPDGCSVVIEEDTDDGIEWRIQQVEDRLGNRIDLLTTPETRYDGHVEEMTPSLRMGDGSAMDLRTRCEYRNEYVVTRVLDLYPDNGEDPNYSDDTERPPMIADNGWSIRPGDEPPF